MVVESVGEKCGGCGFCRGKVTVVVMGSVGEKCGGGGLCR